MNKPTNMRLALVIGGAMTMAIPMFLGVVVDAADDKAPGSLTAKEILEKSDDFHYGYKDSYRKVKVISKAKEGEKKELTWDIWEKGEKRLLVFTDPPELKGMAILVKNTNTMYVYEPDLNKVRKIANHAKKQTMFGMDYTNDEMATTNLHKHYDPKLVEEDSEKAVLMLTQKAGLEKAWPKIKMIVEKNNHWAATKLEYMNAKGKKKKTEKRKKIKKIGGRFIPSVMVMTDHAKKHSTTLILTKCKYNQGLEDKMFTKRYLIREE